MTALNYIIEDLRIRAEKAEAESESRRQMLTEKATELRAEWIRAEKAEAEAENLRAELGQRVAEAENRLDSERARADRYLAAITEYVQATAAEEQAEEVYTSFGSRMMDKSLPPVTKADVGAAFTAVANARNRAYAATTAIRAIAEEVKHD